MLTTKFFAALAVIVLLVVPLLAGAANWMAEAQVAPRERAVKLVLRNFGFNATRGGPDIVVNQGDTVSVTVVSNETTNHNWGIDINSPSAYNVRSQTIRNPGNTTVVQFVANIPGVFKYYCNVGTHRSRGLEGNLIVNVVAPPPLDVSNQVKGLDEQVKSLGSLPNQVKIADDQLKFISSSVNGLTSRQSELKT